MRSAKFHRNSNDRIQFRLTFNIQPLLRFPKTMHICIHNEFDKPNQTKTTTTIYAYMAMRRLSGSKATIPNKYQKSNRIGRCLMMSNVDNLPIPPNMLRFCATFASTMFCMQMFNLFSHTWGVLQRHRRMNSIFYFISKHLFTLLLLCSLHCVMNGMKRWCIAYILIHQFNLSYCAMQFCIDSGNNTTFAKSSVRKRKTKKKKNNLHWDLPLIDFIRYIVLKTISNWERTSKWK